MYNIYTTITIQVQYDLHAIISSAFTNNDENGNTFFFPLEFPNERHNIIKSRLAHVSYIIIIIYTRLPSMHNIINSIHNILCVVLIMIYLACSTRRACTSKFGRVQSYFRAANIVYRFGRVHNAYARDYTQRRPAYIRRVGSINR